MADITGFKTATGDVQKIDTNAISLGTNTPDDGDVLTYDSSEGIVWAAPTGGGGGSSDIFKIQVQLQDFQTQSITTNYNFADICDALENKNILVLQIFLGTDYGNNNTSNFQFTEFFIDLTEQPFGKKTIISSPLHCSMDGIDYMQDIIITTKIFPNENGKAIINFIQEAKPRDMTLMLTWNGNSYNNISSDTLAKITAGGVYPNEFRIQLGEYNIPPTHIYPAFYTNNGSIMYLIGHKYDTTSQKIVPYYVSINTSTGDVVGEPPIDSN